MQVFKFGGSAIKDAGGIRKLAEIVKANPECRVVVVSAFGKTTNALEDLFECYFESVHDCFEKLNRIRQFHLNIVSDLFGENDISMKRELEHCFSEFAERLDRKPGSDYDREYDQIVSEGEIWATRIVHAYLNRQGFNTRWLDARKILVTDAAFRDATVAWKESIKLVKREINQAGNELYIIQGFIAGTENGLTTTLGREGSDFTASILGNILDAECVTLWKDVPGVLNADPKNFPNPEKLDEISYLEAVELAFFGAKVIHPKTIKPLYNKKIPLLVKSFENPDSIGTIIHLMDWKVDLIPVYVIKDNQILVTIRPRDFSFMIEQGFGQIFSAFNACKIKINLVQTSAISLSICADSNRLRTDHLLTTLKKNYRITFNEGVQLITIRHYTDEAIRLMTEGKQILIEQKSRQTVHFVMRDD
jgi:aspartate kinase